MKFGKKNSFNCIKSLNINGSEYKYFSLLEAEKNIENIILELEKKTEDQALKNIDKLKKDLFNFRFQKTNGQLTSPSKVKESKKTIARLKTLIERKFNA